MGFWSDLSLALSEAQYLPLVLLPSSDDKFTLFPEHTVRDLEETKSPSVWTCMAKYLAGKKSSGGDELWAKEIRHPSVSESDDDVEFVFVNGIMTNRDVLTLNGTALSYVFNRPITVMHNPSYGFALDIAECIFGRTFNYKPQITQLIAKEIETKLLSGKKVKLIGHSQGGIIVSNVAEILREKHGSAIFKNLELFTFAGALDQLHTGSNTASEHFANEYDFVARIGSMALDSKIEGETYVRKGALGHLLNMHYLEAFVRGDYCGGNSVLFSYVSPEVKDAVKAGLKQRI